jgi:predicted nucleic acid-binding protein
VLSALGRLQRQGVLTVTDVDEMLDDLAAIAMTRVPITGLVGHAFALRDNVALRDALYVVVAQALDARLLTSDVRLARTCRTLDLCAVHE